MYFAETAEPPSSREDREDCAATHTPQSGKRSVKLPDPPKLPQASSSNLLLANTPTALNPRHTRWPEATFRGRCYSCGKKGYISPNCSEKKSDTTIKAVERAERPANNGRLGKLITLGEVSCKGATKRAPDPGGGITSGQVQLTNHNLMLAIDALLDSVANGEAFIHPRSLHILRNRLPQESKPTRAMACLQE